MRTTVAWTGLAVLVLLGGGAAGQSQHRPPLIRPHAVTPLQFSALNRGKPFVPHVFVTALAAAPNGTLYAGGRWLSMGTNDSRTIGSVFLVSHDHGWSWSSRPALLGQTFSWATGYIYAPWRDHHRWPGSFLVNSISVDPRNSRVLYAAGCLWRNTVSAAGACQQYDPFVRPVHAGAIIRTPAILLRSQDGGHTWQNALSLSFSVNAKTGQVEHFASNIVKTPALLAAINPPYPMSGAATDPAAPAMAYTVAFDPNHSQRLFASVSMIGLIRSEDGGRSWHYLPQTNMIPTAQFESASAWPFGDELLVDSQHPHVIYDLSHLGVLGRSSDDGAHWRLIARLDRTPFAPTPRTIWMA